MAPQRPDIDAELAKVDADEAAPEQGDALGFGQDAARFDRKLRQQLGSYQRQAVPAAPADDDEEPLEPNLGALLSAELSDEVAPKPRPRPEDPSRPPAPSFKPGAKPALPSYAPAPKAIELLKPKTGGHWAAGKRLFDAGDYAAAREPLERGLDQHPDKIEGALTLGRLYVELGEPAQAVPLLERTLEEHQRYELYAMLGDAYGMLGEHERAIAAYQEAVRLHPPYTDGFIKLGTLQYNVRELDEAVKHFDHALTLDREAVTARYYLALICTERNELERATTQIHWIKQKEPGYRQIYLLQATVFERSGDVRSAIGELRQLEKLKLADAAVMYRMGRLEFSVGDEDAALRAFIESLALDETYLPARVATARVLERHGRLEEALNWYRSLERVPEQAADAAEAVHRIESQLGYR